MRVMLGRERQRRFKEPWGLAGRAGRAAMLRRADARWQGAGRGAARSPRRRRSAAAGAGPAARGRRLRNEPVWSWDLPVVDADRQRSDAGLFVGSRAPFDISVLPRSALRGDL